MVGDGAAALAAAALLLAAQRRARVEQRILLGVPLLTLAALRLALAALRARGLCAGRAGVAKLLAAAAAASFASHWAGQVRARRGWRPRRDARKYLGGRRTFDPPAVGEWVEMSFMRRQFQWTERHVPGRAIKEWEMRGDPPGDRAFGAGGAGMGFAEFLARVRADPDARIEPLPPWVDYALLQRGCDFFVTRWPAIFVLFGGAVLGGFGCEEASKVLLESRYWAAKGPEGRRDTARRLKETGVWLYDICFHNAAESFRPDGVAWRCCTYVRFLHSRQRTKMLSKEYDIEKWCMPIGQVLQYGTILGSSTLLLTVMEEVMQVPISDADKEGFIHLWRVIAHLFGIHEDLNPCRDGWRASVAEMESVLAYAIPDQPADELTGNLTRHMMESVQQEGGALGESVEMMAAVPRAMLGDAYGAALGLPEVSRLNRAVAAARLWSMGEVMRLYERPCLAPALGWLHRRAFLFLVRTVQADQPRCRFGSLPQDVKEGRRRPGACPLPGGLGIPPPQLRRSDAGRGDASVDAGAGKLG